MFAGIGGFRSGLEKIGGFKCIGHCEIDAKANQAYNAIYSTEGEVFYADAREIEAETMPDFDLLCAGFPCQSFSVAGKRLGFADDSRGTLFFEIARIVKAKRPPFLLLENVPGLLSHDSGRTYKTIISVLVELGIVSNGVCLTANISEFPNSEEGCSLSDILIVGVPDKYFLSEKAMRKILKKWLEDHRDKESIPLTE